MDSELSEAMNPTEATSHDYKFVKKIQTLVQQGLKTCKELNNSKLDYQRRTKSLGTLGLLFCQLQPCPERGVYSKLWFTTMTGYALHLKNVRFDPPLAFGSNW